MGETIIAETDAETKRPKEKIGEFGNSGPFQMGWETMGKKGTWAVSSHWLVGRQMRVGRGKARVVGISQKERESDVSRYLGCPRRGEMRKG